MAGALDDRGSPVQRKKPDLDPLLVRKDICGSLMKRFGYVLLLSKRGHATGTERRVTLRIPRLWRRTMQRRKEKPCQTENSPAGEGGAATVNHTPSSWDGTG